MMAKISFEDFLKTYFDNLQVEDSLASGQIDTEQKFNEFRTALRAYGFVFTIRSSRKETYGSDMKDDEGKKKIPGRGSLMYKSSSDVSVPFFGYPFFVETTVYYTCAQGIKYYGSKRFPDAMFVEGDPLAKKRRRAKVTQKIGCQARMTVKKIKVFISDDYYVPRDSWREKKAAIDNLKTDLLSDRVPNYVIRFCIVLSLDTAHNHLPIEKVQTKARRSTYDPAKKVIKLQEQIQDALEMLNSDLIGKCTSIPLLNTCCTELKTLINQLRESIDKNDGVPHEVMQVALDKIAKAEQMPKLQCCTNAERRAGKEHRKKNRVMIQYQNIKCETEQIIEDPLSEEQQADSENNENNHIIELPGVLDGTQVIWDPVNVSWIPDGQGLVIQQQESSNSAARDIKPSILVPRKMDDATTNLGVISQGGQNFIVQHSSIPNLGVSVPFTMAKVLQPSTILPGSMKKEGKRRDVGVAIALPANVEWNQHNWGQMVVSEPFQNISGQTVWNIAQQ